METDNPFTLTFGKHPTEYRERLSRCGILDTSQHGYVSLMLPRFAGIVQAYL